ncbi:MAG: hypothetical protein SNJ57_21265 [Cyanobacteriota bacterium]
MPVYAPVYAPVFCFSLCPSGSPVCANQSAKLWAGDRLIESPEVLGINELDHTGMLVRVWIKTIPLEEWSVGREFRLRVRQAFEANHRANAYSGCEDHG